MDFIQTEKDKTFKGLQQLELRILVELDRICRKNGIEYSLGGGTCLGQIRHGGFIPWDDDIDVDMTVPNFRKFIEVCKKELDQNVFRLHCRETDKHYLRSCARLELVGTKISTSSWDNNGMEVGIFVDIFQWSYLPDNALRRKIVSSRLFYIRCIENYKMFGTLAKHVSKKMRPAVVVIGKIVPYKRLLKTEMRLLDVTKGKKTGWIFDDAIINGNHGGYPSDGVDEYTDVTFEGLTVRNKKNPHNFMRTIYGEHYNEWLPCIKRISHHKWTVVDFGPYANEMDLPENYEQYMVIKHTPEHLRQMRKVSLKILKQVYDVCQKLGLKHYVIGDIMYARALGLDEINDLWLEPIMVVMPRDDYDRFVAEADQYLDSRLFIQTHKTDSNYAKVNTRIRLAYTLFRENGVSIRTEETYHNGLYIEVSPMDNCPDDQKEAKAYIKSMGRAQHNINFIARGDRNYFMKGYIRDGLKYHIKKHASLEKNMADLDANLRAYNDKDTDSYYVDSIRKKADKEFFGQGQLIMIDDCPVILPDKIEEFTADLFGKASFRTLKEMEYLAHIKRNKPDYYEEAIERFYNNLSDFVSRRYKYCFLNYYDDDKNQLTVLRYDEKKDILLDNDQVFEGVGPYASLQ